MGGGSVRRMVREGADGMDLSRLMPPVACVEDSVGREWGEGV